MTTRRWSGGRYWRRIGAVVAIGASCAVAAPAVDAQPVIVESPITIAALPSGAGTTFGSRIAHDTVRDRYLVTFIGSGSGVYPFRVVLDGAGHPITSALRLSNGAASSARAQMGGVAFNPTTSQYLAVWSDHAGSNTPGEVAAGARDLVVYGQLLDADGTPVGATTRLTNTPANTFFCRDGSPDVAFDPTTGGYAVVWSRFTSGGTSGSTCGELSGLADSIVRVATFTSSLVQTHEASVPGSRTIEQSHPHIAANAKTGDLVVVWNNTDLAATPGKESTTFARRFTSALVPSGDPITLQTNTGTAGWPGFPAADPLTGNVLVYSGNDAEGPTAFVLSPTGAQLAKVAAGRVDATDAAATGDGGWVLGDAGGVVEIGPTGAVVGERLSVSSGTVAVEMGTGHAGNRVLAAFENTTTGDVQASVVELDQGLRPLASPQRTLDTREGLGAPKRQIPNGGVIDLQVTGRGGVPSSGVGAVVLNLTSTNASLPGFVTAWPTGEERPLASVLNVLPRIATPNLVIAKVGAGGQVSLFNSGGPIDLVADVAGWYPANDGYIALSPSRVLDTRDGTGAPTGAVTAGGAVDLQVTGRGGVPATGVAAVVLNVTAANGTADGFVTVWPTGQERPLASALNVQKGVITPNLVIAKVGAGGKVSLFNSAGAVDLIADVAGYYPDNSGLTSLTPSRILDTREGLGAPLGQLGQGGVITLQVAGRGGVPSSGAGVAVLNITATGGTAGSFVTAWPSDEQRPNASVLNIEPNTARPNLVIAKLSADGKVSLFNNAGRVDLVADVVGWMPA